MLHAGHMNGAEQIQQVFDMITTNSAKTLHLDNYGIAEGNQADLIIFDAATEDDILRLQSECTYVIRKGKVICQTTPARRSSAEFPASGSDRKNRTFYLWSLLYR